ncbi:MAG TPA: porin family protein [Puia sp.]|uniref:porin family protein n=1 Tax=Puia sp. TaxID=2045100 RepID=UPI002BC17A4C|nr:porin family protein [Puia sp.]HVU97077.1 porin family protein [Puia sp.]
MKHILKKLLTSFGLMFLLLTGTRYSFGQTNRFSDSIISTTTNFNYGSLNAALRPYKYNYTGIQVGGYCESPISARFSLVKGVAFSIKGGNLLAKNQLTDTKLTTRLYSVDAPVLFRMYFKRAYVNSGVYAGYILGGRIKTAAGENTPATSTAISFGNSPGEFHHWDFGALIGGGYNFNLKRTVLTADVRYGYGLVSISSDIKRYNRMLGLSLILSRTRN